MLEVKEIEVLKTKVISKTVVKKHYLYELEDTNFYVEGGGQLKDEGTMNGVCVISCFERDGHIYHETEKEVLIENDEVTLRVDLDHRYISSQGHTGQHLISAGFYELFGYVTISHHYDLRGSSIDLDHGGVTEAMCQEVEKWVNQRIAEHLPVEILYPSDEELKELPIRHQIKAQGQIRLVHIPNVEYNPCGGMHVDNTSKVGTLVITGIENIRGTVRIHYLCGQVANNHLHAYYDELKKISIEVSKPMEEAYEGFTKVQNNLHELEMKNSELAQKYIELYYKEFVSGHDENFIVKTCDLDKSLLSKLTTILVQKSSYYGYIMTSGQLIAFAGKDSGKDAKEMFKKVAEKLEIRGGGNVNLCQGGLKNLTLTQDFLDLLKSFK